MSRIGALHLAAAAALVALLVSGCEDAERRASEREVRAVVNRFAEARGAQACDLLAPHALQYVYGRFTADLPAARANCLRQSRGFGGARVKVTFFRWFSKRNARVNVLRHDSKVSYAVTVVKPHGRWLIYRIVPGVAQ